MVFLKCRVFPLVIRSQTRTGCSVLKPCMIVDGKFNMRFFCKRNGKGLMNLKPNRCCSGQAPTSRETIVLLFHQCINCQLLFTRSQIPRRTCYAFHGKPASLAVRKKVWQACRAEATKRLSKESDGEAATTRGLRAQRIGEASHPGPSQAVRMWSQNIRSWHTNGTACLERAQEAGVSLIAFQEMNLRSTAAPAVINTCSRKGWQMIQVSTPNNTTNRGGVSICCREPLGLVPLQQWSSSLGQFILVEVHGASKPFKLFSYYRHADDDDMQGLSQITQILSTDMDQAWVVAMDANMNQLEGTCFDTMTEIGGCCRAHAGHNSSRFPIDGIWSSQDLLAVNAFSEQPGDGDHSLAEVHWNVQTQKPAGQQFRFAHTRKLAENNESGQLEAWAVSCTSESMWDQALCDLDTAWQVWCRDIETWLTRNGFLEQGRPGKTYRISSSNPDQHACCSTRSVPLVKDSSAGGSEDSWKHTGAAHRADRSTMGSGKSSAPLNRYHRTRSMRCVKKLLV